ncbi:MAG: hypothetical protein Q4A24_02495 [Akkermansia sp.]|nr:hypothetical protein [Akkermansia sp.]
MLIVNLSERDIVFFLLRHGGRLLRGRGLLLVPPLAVAAVVTVIVAALLVAAVVAVVVTTLLVDTGVYVIVST